MESLSYFEIETKVRKLISELLSPVLENQREVSKKVGIMSKAQGKFEESLNDLATSSAEAARVSKQQEAFEKKLEDLGSSIRQIEAKVRQGVEDMHSKHTSAVHKVDDALDRVSSLFKTVNGVKHDIAVCGDNLLDYKENVSEQLTALNSQVSHRYDPLLSKTALTDAKVASLSEMVTDISRKAIPELAVGINSNQRHLKDLEERLVLLDKAKLPVEELGKIQKEIKLNMLRIEEVTDKIQEEHVQRETLESNLKETLPAFVHSRISETLYKTFSLDKLKGLIQYEANSKQLRKPFKMNPEAAAMTWNAISAKREKYQEHFKQLELEKDTLVPRQALTPVGIETESVSEIPYSEGEGTMKLDGLIADLQTVQQECAMLKTSTEKLSQDSDELRVKLSEQATHLKDDFNEKMQRNQEELQTLLRMIAEEVSLNSKKLKKNRSDVDNSIHGLTQDTAQLQHETNLINSQIMAAVDRIDNITEFAKIIVAFLGQDEEDKKSLQLTAYSDSDRKLQSASNNRRKNSIMLNGECMSCNGHNPAVLKAFKMACINYYPTPVKYQNKLMTRKEVLELLGSFVGCKLPEASLAVLSEQKRPVSTRRRSARTILDLNLTSKTFLDFAENPAQSSRNFKIPSANLATN